jgi:hypothetical protein
VGIGRRGEYCTKRGAFRKPPDSEIDLGRDCSVLGGTFVDIRSYGVDSNVMGGFKLERKSCVSHVWSGDSLWILGFS